MANTPGPWYANGDCIEADGPEGPRDLTVATAVRFRHAACDLDISREEWQSNARLIAAAPEMLAVCKAIASDLSLFQFTDGEYRLSEWPAGVILQSLREVIAKAEGRE